jgi:outer membrane protein assembly complex protein YaeT
MSGFPAARPLLRLGLLAAAAIAMLPAARPAQAQGADGRPVADIVVDAPAALVDPVRSAVVARVGEPLDATDVRRAIQNIYALGRVSDVQVAEENTGNGVRLRFRVLPAARVEAIRFEGSSPLGRRDLRNALSTAQGDRITRALLEEQAARVQEALSDRGYLGAVVEPELLLSADLLSGTLVFHLRPGAATRLDRLGFVGDLGITEAAAREAFGLREGGVFRYDQLGEGIERLRRSLAENRFFYANVEIEDQALNQAQNTADLVLRIDAGPLVNLQFRGWDRSEEELRSMLPFVESASVADWILNQARADLIAELQRQGYWKPLVSYGRVRDEEGRNVEVTFTVAPVRRTALRRVELRGNTAFPEQQLLELLQTHASGVLRGARFSSATWEEDQRNLVAFYRGAGFLQARIVDAPVRYDPDLDGLVAVMEIDEGGRTHVSELQIDILGELDEYGIDSSGWVDQLTTRGGGPFDPDAVRQDETRLRILLSNQGFPRAQVRSEVDEGEDPYQVDVRFTVQPGRRARVGTVLISGNETVRDDVIRRQLTLVPGSPFTQESVILSQSRLYRLGIFARVDIDTAVPDTIEAEPTVVVRVTEGSSRRLSWGLGYSTDEQVRGTFVLGEDNLWGLNHRATMSVRASFVEQRARFIYTDPYLLGRRLEGSLVGYYENTAEEGYNVQRVGVSAQVVKRHTSWLSSIWRYSYRDQQTYDVQIDPADLQPEDTDALVGSLGYSLLIDTRPNPIDPRSGSYHSVDVEWASRAFGSQPDYIKLFARSYKYWEAPGNSVFVAAARAGLAVPYRDSIVPLPNRFLAGGSTSLRGYGRNLAGPTDANGNPLGGNVLLIGNLEYRFPVRSSLGGVIFTDIGNVFANPDTVALSRVSVTVGLGVRYGTPIGPLRLDWGYLLEAPSDQGTARIHFAIGQAF